MRTALGLFEFASSLKLAVLLIFCCAAALAWATFVESAYGTPAVQFGMYGTWWFALLNLLLAINIFCAAAIRFPWKRHQTGFVITHIGLLTLLFGCLIQRRGGIDAQMPIFEGQIGHRAFEDTYHFQLAIENNRSTSLKPTVVSIPLTAGPFNWEDYTGRLSRPMRSIDHESAPLRALTHGFAKLNGMLFRLARRDRGMVYDRDGVKLEVLDYYSDSTEVDAPMVKLRMTTPRMTTMDADGKPVEGRTQWMPLAIRVLDQSMLGHRLGIAGREERGGGAVTFGLAGSQEEVDAFLQSGPTGKLGDDGVVVFFIAGKPTQISVDENRGKGKFSIGDSGLQGEIVEQFDTAKIMPSGNGKPQWINDAASTKAENPMVRVQLYRDGKPLSQLTLFADLYEYGVQDYENQIYASYWFDHKADTAEKRKAGEARSRIDLLQLPLMAGRPAELVYRYWNGTRLVFANPLPTDGTSVPAFEMTLGRLMLVVDELIPAAKPERKIVPLPFDAKKMGRMPAAKVRLTVDSKSDEFWLAAIPWSPEDRPPFPAEKREVASDKLAVTMTMPPDQVNLGFGVRLDDFERKLDPGTSQASHYSSTVDFVNLETGKPLQENVWITMNAPVDFSDPTTGRSYRLFQESFSGPIRPGSSEFDKYFAARGLDEGYMSTLTVNYDPGRAVKYSGCLLITVGIATMFYMRAYFFKPAARKTETAAAARPERSREPVRSGG